MMLSGKAVGVISLILVVCSTICCGVDQEPRATSSCAELVIRGARKELEKGTVYRGGYYELDYPGGDLPGNFGVCTDLIIRAFRNADVDLQELVYVDKRDNGDQYPLHIWEYRKPDYNIDHRRCQNLCVLFKRRFTSIPTNLDKENLDQWQAGDVVFFAKKGNEYPWHVGIVSDKKTAEGIPYIIHLYPPTISEQIITDFLPIHSHFRPEEKNATPSTR